MRQKIFCLIVFLSFFFLAQASAEVSVKAEIDKLKLSRDEVATYKVIIVSSEKEGPKLELPKFEAFKVVSQAQSSTFSFRGGKSVKQLVFIYILAPQQTGKLKIAPAVVKLKSETYPTAAFEVEVTPSLHPEGRPNLGKGEAKYTL